MSPQPVKQAFCILTQRRAKVSPRKHSTETYVPSSCLRPRGMAQLGSALRSGRRGRGFKSRYPDQVETLSHLELSGRGRVSSLAAEPYFLPRFRVDSQRVRPVLKVATSQAPTAAAPQPGVTWQNCQPENSGAANVKLCEFMTLSSHFSGHFCHKPSQ